MFFYLILTLVYIKSLLRKIKTQVIMSSDCIDSIKNYFKHVDAIPPYGYEQNVLEGLGTLAFADTTVGTGNLVGSIHNDVTASVHGAIALHHG